MTLLKGKLTYTISAVSIIWAIVGLVIGQLDGATAGNIILASLAAFGIRRAI